MNNNTNFYGYSNDNVKVSPRGEIHWPNITIDTLHNLNTTLCFNPITNSWNYCNSETDSELFSESESKSWTDSENSIETTLKEFMKTEANKLQK